ncbi:murein biosynthesis integral membrane protein MurJ [Adlercreutzia murintestinalis]|uniref:murein biosynthesis integral membrane protein MurJ n=1 Tax=Adlercreutzia murintestinalis TaxID=2941325 RepID=UPI00203BD820|nr:murein biosynthesis integral membrane protein MurJ [Adlercreutzia murintestinalis]
MGSGPKHAIRPDSRAEALESADITASADQSSAPPPSRNTAPADATNIGASAALISICTIISRITGFARTWAMAFALGATFLSSSYQVANNLPNMLYELVMGGMLSTAFLPVYLSLKRNAGRQASRRYASNLLTLVVLGLGALSLICILFPAQVIYTQTFFSNQEEMGTAVLLFRFFAIQLVFYGASSIISGLLNANRDYIWGAIAPVFNNLAVIATFIAYAYLAPNDPQLALLVIAIGNPAGVAIQLLIQLPGLRRNGILLTPRINFHDPGLRETVRLGVPALIVTLIGFVTVSVANAASYTFADNGPSVIAYARLWFTFPYSFLAIPVATALFTELSDMQAKGNTEGVVRGIIGGTTQIFFLMIPFGLYLIAFSQPLVSLYHIGAFTEDAIGQIARYLAVMAVALPFYGVNTYLQMAFSSIRRMKAFSIFTLIASLVQVGIIVGAVAIHDAGGSTTMDFIAAGTIAAYALGDVLELAYLKKRYGRPFKVSAIVKTCLRALIVGAAGAAVGAVAFWGLNFACDASGNVPLTLAYLLVAGALAMGVTFTPAIRGAWPEAAFATGILNRVRRLVGRGFGRHPKRM